MHPREAELLLERVGDLTAMMQDVLEYMADPGHVKTPEDTANRLHSLIRMVRSVRFDVVRVSDLTVSDTAALRAIYSHSTVAVDRVRTSGALGDPIAALADIQDLIAQRFPGDVPEA